MDIFTRTGSRTIDLLTSMNAVFSIIMNSLISFLFRFRAGRRAILSVFYKQVYFTGVEALSTMSLIALTIGIIIVTQALSILPSLNSEGLIGNILVWIVVRELGPIFAAVIVIARSGTAIASELGAMKVNNEVTALKVMGIDTDRYLVMPRVIGTATAVLGLTFCFEVVAIMGGYLLAGFGHRITFAAYTASIFNAIQISDVASSSLKSVIFGLVIGAVACHHGLRVGKSITQIPQETTKAVIRSLFLIFIVDGIVTAIFFV